MDTHLLLEYVYTFCLGIWKCHPAIINFSIIRYGGFYLLIKSGVDIPAILESIGTSEVSIAQEDNDKYCT